MAFPSQSLNARQPFQNGRLIASQMTTELKNTSKQGGFIALRDLFVTFFEA